MNEDEELQDQEQNETLRDLVQRWINREGGE